MSVLTLPTAAYNSILDALSPAEMLKYSRTCKAARSSVQTYMQHAFSVDKLLSPYFTSTEVIRFRKLQCDTGALISGSTALQFFDRVTYSESDLDVYVEHRFSRTLAEWLLEIGYTYAPLPESDNVRSLEEAFKRNPPGRPHAPDIFSGDIFFDSAGKDYFKAPFVFNFEKQNPYRKIQLITSLQSPLQRILSYHSTCVMNVITHNAGYSFFPWATLQERRSLICLEGSEILDKAFHKYTGRGWTFVTLEDLRLKKKDAPYSSFEVGKQYAKDAWSRYVGDRWCWKIPLAPVLDLPKGYIETNSWAMDCGVWCDNPSMGFQFLVMRNLKFSYLVESDNDCDLEEYISDHMGSCDWEARKEPKKEDDKLQALVRKYRAEVESYDDDAVSLDDADDADEKWESEPESGDIDSECNSDPE